MFFHPIGFTVYKQSLMSGENNYSSMIFWWALIAIFLQMMNPKLN